MPPSIRLASQIPVPMLPRGEPPVCPNVPGSHAETMAVGEAAGPVRLEPHAIPVLHVRPSGAFPIVPMENSVVTTVAGGHVAPAPWAKHARKTERVSVRVAPPIASTRTVVRMAAATSAGPVKVELPARPVDNAFFPANRIAPGKAVETTGVVEAAEAAFPAKPARMVSA